MTKNDNHTIKVKQVRSLSGIREIHKKSVKGLGLRKINHVVEVKNSPENWGMINKVKHLVKFDKV